MQMIKDTCIGAVLGIANVIPGISAATMAIVMGVYDKLLNLVSLNFKKIKEDIKTYIFYAIGLAIGILVFSNVITYLFDHFYMATNFFFIGVVLGSLPMIYKSATETKLKAYNIIPFLVTLGIMVALAFIKVESEGQSVMRALTAGNFFLLLAAGAVASCAMIIPGISGSFMLIVMGMYQTVITAVKELNILILLPTAIGIIIGLVGGGVFIKFMLKRFPQGIYMAILGLILGSVLTLYPGFTFNLEGLCAALVAVGGFVLSMLMSKAEN